MYKNLERKNTYDTLSHSLSQMDEAQLQQLISTGVVINEGIGGRSVQVEYQGTPIFVKKVPVGKLEQEHFQSTANFYNLPLCYQYGIGSAGFGVWRELKAHQMTTRWVLEEECAHFPLMYHWCFVEEAEEKSISKKEQEELEETVLYWENSPAIRHRLQDRLDATSYVYLFLEYVPHTLHDGLSHQFEVAERGDVSNFIERFDKQLSATNLFMSKQGFLHMDAHFKNVLTDGKNVYFADFGLATSKLFDLSPEESDFLTLHENYDQACTATNLLHTMASLLHKQSAQGRRGDPFNFGYYLDQFKGILKDSEKNPFGEAFIPLRQSIQKYMGIASKMSDFYGAIQKKNLQNTPHEKFHH